ncbi:MAG: hypothetical protein OQK32_03460 [Gammaproteobacteria bacterium]|nr:hypothetical protein [Gammaproteobacteria bacterium]MCW8924511.1 hypothetical protein [Gammaproteobacteria bacterium]
MSDLVGVGNVVGINDGLSLIAYDQFTDTDGTNLSAHTSDTGHSWLAVAGQINIVGNQAKVVTAPAHYVMDLSAEAKQPAELLLQIKDTDATEQRAEKTIRDESDGLNYIELDVYANSTAAVLTINEVKAGVSVGKATKFILGDYRDELNFFGVIVRDLGDSIILDASIIEPNLVAKWSGAPSPTGKGIGLFVSDSRTTNVFDYPVVSG